MDLKNLYKQAQQMQNKMQQVQSDLENEIVKGESGGGAIAIHSNCKGEVQKVKIIKEFIDLDDDIEILEDLILAAFNDAKKKAESKANERMSSAGLPNNLMP
jgi:DNA-binding YbaB/EbfC family protein